MSNTIHVEGLPYRITDSAYIGDTWEDAVEIWEGDSVADMTEYDLSGAAFTATLKNPNGETVETFTEGDGITVTDNLVTIVIPASVTADFTDKCCYSMDLQAVWASPAKTLTFVRYSITAYKDVTT